MSVVYTPFDIKTSDDSWTSFTAQKLLHWDKVIPEIQIIICTHKPSIAESSDDLDQVMIHTPMMIPRKKQKLQNRKPWKPKKNTVEKKRHIFPRDIVRILTDYLLPTIPVLLHHVILPAYCYIDLYLRLIDVPFKWSIHIKAEGSFLFLCSQS